MLAIYNLKQLTLANAAAHIIYKALIKLSQLCEFNA